MIQLEKLRFIQFNVFKTDRIYLKIIKFVMINNYILTRVVKFVNF